MIRNGPISAVERTCVPPHSSREYSPSPTSTMRTTSPYFSPNSAIAPRRLASSSVVVIGRTGSLRAIHSLTRSSTSRSSSSAQPLAVAEVEAQLVRADVGAGLAHVAAEALAQRRLQQVRRRVVGLGRVARAAVDRAPAPARPARSSPCSTRPISAWSSPRRNTSSTRARQSPSLAFDRARVGDLAAAGRVEGRLGELHQVAARAPFRRRSRSSRADRRRAARSVS